MNTTGKDKLINQNAEKGSLFYTLMVSFVAAVGGLLFGFDTGVISGAITFINEKFNLNSVQSGFVVSNLMIACTIGALISGGLADRYGRKKILIIAALLFGVSAVLSALPRTYSELVAARFIGGIAVGFASVVSPMYIAEISPAYIRGRLVAINQIAIVIGVLSSFFSNWLLVDIGPDNWRWMFAVGIVPSVLFFIGLFFVPESPRWLVKHGDSNKAFDIFAKVGGQKHAGQELREVQATLHEEKVPFSELLRPGIRKAMLVGILFALFAHITGIDTITYYGPVIFMKAGVTKASSALFASVIIGLTNLVFTIIGISLIDKFGRKPLMLIGLAGMGVSIIVTGAAFQNPSLGYYVLLFSILAYIASFALSIGVVIWVYTSEIFPNRVRGKALSIATMILWLSNVVVTQTFPLMMEKLGGKTFYMYGAVCFAAFVFILTMVSETKGKTLEEIEGMWK